MYKKEFIKTWKNLKKYPLFILPDFILLITSIALGLTFIKLSGFLDLITNPEILTYELKALTQTIIEHVKTNLFKTTISITSFFVSSFIIGSGLIAMKMGMMKDFMINKKPSLKNMFKNTKYFWKIVTMKATIFLIGTVTFLFLTGATLITYSQTPKEISSSIIMTLTLATILILRLILLFRYPIMLMENLNPITTVKKSYHYFMNNKKHIFITWAIIFAIGLTALPITILLGLIQTKGIISLFIAGYIIKMMVDLIIKVWQDLFRFRTYKLKKPTP